MKTIAYTRFRLDVSYRKTNSDDLGDLGRVQNGFTHGNFTYKVTIRFKDGSSIKQNGQTVKAAVFKGKLDKNGESEDISIKVNYEHIETVNNDLSAYWEIYLEGERIYDAYAKSFYNHSKEGDQISGHKVNASWSVGHFPIARIHTKLIQAETKNYEETVRISSGLGWYLVKKPEAFGDLVNRIYRNPSNVEWDIMTSNNPHIKNASSRATMLQAGQVVVICNTKSEKNAPLQQMKEDAKQCQAKWEKLYQKHRFDPLFFQTMDVVIEAGGKAAIAKEVKDGDNGPSVTWLGELTPQASYTNGGLKLWTLDSFLAFNDAALKRAGQSYKAVMSSVQDVANRSGKASTVGKRVLSSLDPKEVAILKSSLGNAFLRAETGLQTDSLRNQINSLSQVRGVNTQGGIKNYTAFMEMSGKASTALRTGSWLALGIEAYGAGSNIVDAHSEGKEIYRKAVITESLKVGVSAAGGAAGGWAAGAGVAWLIGGSAVATGGMSLVIIGLGAVIGAGMGQIYGKQKGSEWGQDISNNTDFGREVTDSMHDAFNQKEAAKRAIENSKDKTIDTGID